MNYSKKYINEIAEQTGFIANNIEKVIRLLDVLDFIFSKSSFKDALSLKGGTAINLVYTNMKRLSVDIDLDYHRHIDKEKMIKDRKLILQELDDYMEKEGYRISNKSRGSTILASRTYSYLSASNNNDNIKVEINFIDRIGLFPDIATRITYFGKTINIISPSKEELYGMKIAAVIDRSKPRDLYDTAQLLENLKEIDLNKLKKSAVFYLSLDKLYKIDESSFKGIKAISPIAVKKELFPVIKRGEKFNLGETQERVIDALSNLLSLDKKELRYLEEFSEGNYNPSLLFDNTVSQRAEIHPMARWRVLNIKQQKR